ncbi:MAG: site-specific DNA-methyltransferase [Chloroflexaceae bacterium]|nr:site-specific DNA-methyltransferase [Chloroflexaceae bacterium]
MEAYKQHSIDDKVLANGTSSFNDPAFASNKQAPIHRWVPWIAGFSSSFVRDTLERHTEGTQTVLDPFAGVGTTLVEAVLLGHAAIGFELNPYAALACRLKVQAPSSDPHAIAPELERFRNFYAERVHTAYTPSSMPPEGFRTRAPFYSPVVLRKVLIVQDFISTMKDSQVRELFQLAFAATMVAYSNYSYEPSLGRRATADKPDIVDFPVDEVIYVKLEEMIADIIWCKDHVLPKPLAGSVVNKSWFQYQDYLAPDTVDIVITSPPYLNNYHYNRNTRPQLYWLGFAQSPKDFHALAHANFGTFWQTVREQPRLDVNFPLPGSDLAERLAYLRQLNPERGIYGGNGWANYASAYFKGCR